MRTLMLVTGWLCAIVSLVAASPARATGDLTFAYVSNTGSDSNFCDTPADACQTLSSALAKTTNFGEIDCINTILIPRYACRRSTRTYHEK